LKLIRSELVHDECRTSVAESVPAMVSFHYASPTQPA
jgi:hypothetical protein